MHTIETNEPGNSRSTPSGPRRKARNCEPQMFPGDAFHGWLYEFEVYGGTNIGESDATQVEVKGGALSVDKPNVRDFAPVTLNGSPKTTTASMRPFSVADATGTGAGWKLAAQASQFAEADPTGAYVPGGKTLPTESLSLDGLTVAPDGTTSPPPMVQAGPHILDGPGAVTLLTASAGAGMGRFVVTPSPLTLAVPSDAFARTYRSDVTLSLVSGP